ncbi:alpha/beta hydrolase [Granulosicoccus antarcticus]|uniref:Enterochelin esterase n=1 Tax=Granulosicoccus antarcticus IMCC3135 TaxID=1192854 RepID=A0A2Z2NIB5_9GAMM|nr:alpha/beta hydrolase-fold protein [Granulosicoccus antarcticus]ASJ71066.1 Enterochelin esterase [Granulosicoccus antarcticus IMCC3135]
MSNSLLPDGEPHPAVSELLAQPLTPERLQQFTVTQTFPLAAPGCATFVWVGDASQVTLLRWIHGGVDRAAFEQVPNTPLWLLNLPVKDGGRFEYKLGVERDGNEEWLIDPLNQARAGDPFGENSVCRTYGYSQPEWSKPQGAEAGTIIPFPVESTVFEQTRNEQIYLPAQHDPDTAYRLLVIHDGADFITYADLATSLDNLIASGTIPPVIVALVQTHDRLSEYARGHRHARYLVYDLLPQLESSFRLSERSEDRVLLGASLGAVVSLATIFRYPGVFGGAVLQSGSFILDEKKLEGRQHPVFERVARLVRAVRRSPGKPELRAFVSTGELEGLASENEALAKLLQEIGVSVLFKSAWDGHHWHNWRDQLRDGLVWVLKH